MLVINECNLFAAEIIADRHAQLYIFFEPFNMYSMSGYNKASFFVRDKIIIAAHRNNSILLNYNFITPLVCSSISASCIIDYQIILSSGIINFIKLCIYGIKIAYRYGFVRYCNDKWRIVVINIIADLYILHKICLHHAAINTDIYIMSRKDKAVSRYGVVVAARFCNDIVLDYNFKAILIGCRRRTEFACIDYKQSISSDCIDTVSFYGLFLCGDGKVKNR